MKKIITLFASVILVASAFAQSNEGRYERGKENDVVYNDSRFDRNNDRFDKHDKFSKRKRDIQIAQINREYDQRIHAVRNKWFTSNSKKQRIIYQLEDERRYEIKKVYARYNRGSNRFDDHDRRREW